MGVILRAEWLCQMDRNIEFETNTVSVTHKEQWRTLRFGGMADQVEVIHLWLYWSWEDRGIEGSDETTSIDEIETIVK